MLGDPVLADELRFILNLGVAVAAALAGGAIATRLRQPTVVGYVAAGVVIGPFTPGFVADREQIAALADVGVVLLLFALGIEFSVRELIAVRRVAVGAGLLQVALTAVAAAFAGLLLGLDLRTALITGSAVAISSTLVVVKLLLERGEIESTHGRALVGWMIVQDLTTVVIVVTLPTLAGSDPLVPLLTAAGMAVLFLTLAFLVGSWLLPRLFSLVARLGSRELFLLAVMGTALLASALSGLAGLGIALGAFVAGLLVSESDLSHQAAADVTPFRDVFAVLFFVSVGMLVDPTSLGTQATLVITLVVVTVAVKGALAAGLARLFGLPVRSALLLGATLGQMGEFSFIIAEEALGLGVLARPVYDAILGSAVGSIVATPLALRAVDRLVVRLEARRDARAATATPPGPGEGLGTGSAVEPAVGSDRRPHVVVLGAGRAGLLVTRAVRTRGFGCIVVDDDRAHLDEAAQLGARTLYGDVASPEILAETGLDTAHVVIVAVADPLTARLATERVLRRNPRVNVAARARGARERAILRTAGARRVSDPEVEAGIELARHALQRMGVAGPELQAIAIGLRRAHYGADLGPDGAARPGGGTGWRSG